MLKTLSVSALFALTLSGDAGVEPDPATAGRSDEYVCLSDEIVHGEIQEAMQWVTGEIETPPTDPLPLYCIAKCVGPNASTGFKPIAGPTTPVDILRDYPYVDPYKWCDYVAEKTCAQLGPDVKVGGSCFGSRI